MTDKELKKLNRQDLLRLLLEAEKENQSLRTELEDAKKKLESRQIIISEAGNLAEASLRLSGVFEDAQRAVDIYIQNAQQVSQEQERKAAETLRSTEQKCREMEETCRSNCERMRTETLRWAADCKEKVIRPIKEYVRLHSELFDAPEDT